MRLGDSLRRRRSFSPELSGLGYGEGAGARAYNGGLGAEPPVGSATNPLSGNQGVGPKPLKLTSFCCRIAVESKPNRSYNRRLR